ncbi:MAG: acetolactate synthase small subunit [Actinomycetota bacterium]
MSLHTLSVLVENRPGVLTRVAGLFAARGFNIHSLAVGETEIPDYSRMTIVVDLQAKSLEQVVKQLNKLVNIIKVLEYTDRDAVERELALVKVRTKGDQRARVIEIADIFRCRVVGVTSSTVTVEATGTPDKVEALLELLHEFGIVELARTGRIALSRDEKGIRERTLKAASSE